MEITPVGKIELDYYGVDLKNFYQDCKNKNNGRMCKSKMFGVRSGWSLDLVKVFSRLINDVDRYR